MRQKTVLLFPKHKDNSMATLLRRCNVASTVALCFLGLCASSGYTDEPATKEVHDVFAMTPEEFHVSQEKKPELPAEEGRRSDQLPVVEKADYRITLPSGLVLDIGKVFESPLAEYHALMRKSTKLSSRSVIRLYDQKTRMPMLVAQRRGRILDGTFASYTSDGSPVAFASYERGTLQASLLTWDEAKRPFVFSQYSDGELHGIRCLFRGCCDSCKDGHVWLAEEWEHGSLRNAHLARTDGRVSSVSGNADEYSSEDDEWRLANDTLASFEKRLSEDEADLKTFVAQYYQREKQAESNRIQLSRAKLQYQLSSVFQSARIPNVSSAGFG